MRKQSKTIAAVIAGLMAAAALVALMVCIGCRLIALKPRKKELKHALI